MRHLFRTTDTKAWKEHRSKWITANFTPHQVKFLIDSDNVAEIDKERRSGTTYVLAAQALLWAIDGEETNVVCIDYVTTSNFLTELGKHIKTIGLTGFFDESMADRIVDRITVSSAYGVNNLRSRRSNVILDDYDQFDNRDHVWDVAISTVSTGGKLRISRNV